MGSEFQINYVFHAILFLVMVFGSCSIFAAFNRNDDGLSFELRAIFQDTIISLTIAVFFFLFTLTTGALCRRIQSDMTPKETVPAVEYWGGILEEEDGRSKD